MAKPNPKDLFRGLDAKTAPEFGLASNRKLRRRLHKVQGNANVVVKARRS